MTTFEKIAQFEKRALNLRALLSLAGRGIGAAGRAFARGGRAAGRFASRHAGEAGAVGAGLGAGLLASHEANNLDQQARGLENYNNLPAMTIAKSIRDRDAFVKAVRNSDLQRAIQAEGGKRVPEMSGSRLLSTVQNLEPWKKAVILSALGYGGGSLLDTLAGREDTGNLGWILGLGVPAAYGAQYAVSHPDKLKKLLKAFQGTVENRTFTRASIPLTANTHP